MRIRATLSAFALLGLVATTAQAQNPIEVGIDAQISFGLDDQGTSISIPAQKVRAGFVINPAMTIEPSLGFFRTSDDAMSASTADIDVSLLYHFSTLRTAKQYYLRPVVGLRRVSFTDKTIDESASDSEMNIGVAGGVKIPLMDRVGARAEAEFRNYLSDPSVSAFNLNFGLSYYTR
ncbi:MAG TPA: outer membrane beta-barrel protein [Gemmatimonadaceae bacterium]|nr:outer membrane beta-barrel protein [Gemmatimonadaceae bacterium]